jgi:GNAT superfamily N-acetyltransferase
VNLVLATEQQKRLRDPLAWEEWGAALTPEQFAVRERRLRSHPWARKAMATWLLADDEGNALSSCETFRMRSLLRAGDVESQGWTFAVASVLTEPRLRGRGFASRMMRLLVERLAREDSAHASILFSDVGAQIYEQSGGFVALPAIDRVFEPSEGGSETPVDALLGDGDVEGELARVAAPCDAFVVWPEAGQLDWHLERERAYAALLERPRPEACGARAGEGRIFWAGDFKNDRLVVLLLAAQSPEEAGALLEAAQRTAGRARLREVRLWDYRGAVDWSRVRDPGRLEPRAGALPMIAPLRADISPDSLRLVPRALWV